MQYKKYKQKSNLKKTNFISNNRQVLAVVLVLTVSIIGAGTYKFSSAATVLNGASIKQAYGCNSRPTLANGSSGPCVKAVQAMMQTFTSCLGCQPYADSKYGNQTKWYVATFQNNNKLYADGIVGQNTWSSLESKSLPDLNGDGRRDLVDLSIIMNRIR